MMSDDAYILLSQRLYRVNLVRSVSFVITIKFHQPFVDVESNSRKSNSRCPKYVGSVV